MITFKNWISNEEKKINKCKCKCKSCMKDNNCEKCDCEKCDCENCTCTCNN